MARWKKLLARIAVDPKPVGYSYDDVAAILGALGFVRSGGKGSHRVWTRQPDGSATLRVTLVDPASGPVAKVYIREMAKILREAGLMPSEPDEEEM